jgi:hypothetical protein
MHLRQLIGFYGCVVLLCTMSVAQAAMQHEVTKQELQHFTRRGYSSAGAGQLVLQDIATAVYERDQHERPTCDPVLVSVQPLSKNGQGEQMERWSVKGCNNIVQYYVMFTRVVEEDRYYLDVRVSTEQE